MTKFLTKRNAILAGVAGTVLVGGVAVYAEAGGGGDITLDAMLEKVGERFDEVDTDGDGVISVAESEAAQSARSEAFSARMAERIVSQFERMDADGDGVVSEGDRGYGRLSDHLDLSGDLTLEQIQAAAAEKMALRMGERETEGGDDQPTFPQTRDEALAEAQTRFAEADTNGDGILSGDEKPKRGGHGGGKGGHRGGNR